MADFRSLFFANSRNEGDNERSRKLLLFVLSLSTIDKFCFSKNHNLETKSFESRLFEQESKQMRKEPLNIPVSRIVKQSSRQPQESTQSKYNRCTRRVLVRQQKTAKFVKAKRAIIGALLCTLATTAASLSNVQAIASAKGTIELEARLVDNLSKEINCPIYSWSNTSSPHAVIVAIHGATLHGRSYTTLGESLSRKGYAVFAPDMRGFGSWYHDDHPGEEFPKHVLYKRSERDLKALLAKLREIYPRKPIYLIGESVGANMAIRLLALDETCADGMILSSPAIRQRYFFGPSVFKQIVTVFFWNPKAQLDVTPFLRSRVSESPEITDERVNDSLARNKMNAGELFKTRWFNKDSLLLAPALPENKPVLVLEGAEDKLFKADDIHKLMNDLPMADKRLELMPGQGHIHLETKYLKPQVEELVSNWLAEKSQKYAREIKSPQSQVSSVDPSKPRTTTELPTQSTK
jgi:alpha-beta hydrolase superfamily lysophospholipase